MATPDLKNAPRQPGWSMRAGEIARSLLDPALPVPGDLSPQSQSQVRQRFAVYRNNVAVGLVNVLAANFPSTRAILGEDNFRIVARNFILSHPPKSPVMAEYGGTFPGFLANFPPLARSPFLADLASLEWLWVQAYHALDEAPLDAGTLAQTDADIVGACPLVAHPAAAVIASRHAIATLFEARNEWPQPSLDVDEPQVVLVSRPGLEVMVTRLDMAEAAFFQVLLDGESLSSAIGAALAAREDFDAGAAIALMLATGAFAGFDKLVPQEREMPDESL